MSRITVLFTLVTLGATAGLLCACTATGDKRVSAPSVGPTSAVANPVNTAFVTTEVAKFSAPWAMTFLPDGRLLVTEMGGALKLYDPAGNRTGVIRGVPKVEHVAQGGLGDVALHPDYANNQRDKLTPTRQSVPAACRPDMGTP